MSENPWLISNPRDPKRSIDCSRPVRLSMRNIPKPLKRDVAERCLERFAAMAAADYKRLQDQGVEANFQLVSYDYQLWAKRFQEYVSSGFFKARIEQITNPKTYQTDEEDAVHKVRNHD